MKIGILGKMSPSLMIALQHAVAFKAVVLIEAKQDQLDEYEQGIAIIGDPIMCEFRPTPSISGKTGSNKSDRKRNRKNRWR